MIVPRDAGGRLPELLANEFLDRLPFLPNDVSFQFWPSQSNDANSSLLDGWGVAVPADEVSSHEYAKEFPVCSSLLVVEALLRHARSSDTTALGIQQGDGFIALWLVTSQGLAAHRVIRHKAAPEQSANIVATLKLLLAHGTPANVFTFVDPSHEDAPYANLHPSLTEVGLPAAKPWPKPWPYLERWGTLALNPQGGLPQAFHWRGVASARDLRRWGAVVAVVFALAAVESSLKTSNLNAEMRSIDRVASELIRQEAPGLEAGSQPLRAVRTELVRLEEVVSSRRDESPLARPMEVLAAIGAVIRLHPAAEIASTEFRGDSLVVNGKASSFKAIDLFRADLEKKSEFGVVQLGNAEKSNEADSINFQFIIRAAQESAQ
jgi:hypothetical protein